MKLYVFLIWLSKPNCKSESVRVMAFTKKDALKLVRTERIREGLGFTLDWIQQVTFK